MGKVSIGLRGWRFDEDDVFAEGGGWLPLDEMPYDARHRLVRLQVVMEKPCDACYLIHGEENKRQCRQAAIVYGEPMEEVVLCDEHEADFLYWFRERGGSELAGEETFRDAFHEWFDDGGRAPEGYGGMEHVEEAPDELPELPDPEDIYDEELLEDDRADFEEGEGERSEPSTRAGSEATRERGEEAAGGDDSGVEADDDGDGDSSDDEEEVSMDDLDLGREYPR